MIANGAAPPRPIHPWSEELAKVRSREDLAAFVRTLQINHVRCCQEWGNKDLPSYLDSLSGWIEDMDGYFQNLGQTVPDQPSWQLVAAMLLAAKSYE